LDAANNKLLGEDADKIFGNMMQYVTNFEEVTGRIRPDLTYSSK
jgi:hypothetical protein